jgi:hypothetical protein
MHLKSVVYTKKAGGHQKSAHLIKRYCHADFFAYAAIKPGH